MKNKTLDIIAEHDGWIFSGRKVLTDRLEPELREYMKNNGIKKIRAAVSSEKTIARFEPLPADETGEAYFKQKAQELCERIFPGDGKYFFEYKTNFECGNFFLTAFPQEAFNEISNLCITLGAKLESIQSIENFFCGKSASQLIFIRQNSLWRVLEIINGEARGAWRIFCAQDFRLMMAGLDENFDAGVFFGEPENWLKEACAEFELRIDQKNHEDASALMKTEISIPSFIKTFLPREKGTSLAEALVVLALISAAFVPVISAAKAAARHDYASGGYEAELALGVILAQARDEIKNSRVILNIPVEDRYECVIFAGESKIFSYPPGTDFDTSPAEISGSTGRLITAALRDKKTGAVKIQAALY